MFRSLALAGTLMLATAQAFAADARATIDALSQALQAGKAAEAAAMFSENAGYAYSVDGALNDGARFDAWYQSDIAGPGSRFMIESATVDGGKVDAMVLWGRGEMTTPARYIFEVVDGAIVSWRMTSR